MSITTVNLTTGIQISYTETKILGYEHGDSVRNIPDFNYRIKTIQVRKLCRLVEEALYYAYEYLSA
jgi:hypothetical protein